MAKKIVVARLQVVKGKEKEYLSLVTPLIEATKSECGNLVYKLYQDIQNSSEFIAYEEYVNEEAFNKHCSTEFFQSFAKDVQILLAKEIDIQIF
ncbi:antibiotic biosynthesis monooxygenase [Dysgonomonas sp. Marseille-P4677]|uniref:putative quinol monooxygenase n=1 Tax=Dysgonomonas sp. Marseille-P4677 TaxID=2364790 RepID=UPI0019114466|nr:putative quinol monooxygenase [Dysgonomonas sp. Marseille-P4677]MBK5721808.1 antibiotic biosynthesis monooxygenase [Dysgonomonas sp. Marseille-P4677]